MNLEQEIYDLAVMFNERQKRLRELEMEIDNLKREIYAIDEQGKALTKKQEDESCAK